MTPLSRAQAGLDTEDQLLPLGDEAPPTTASGPALITAGPAPQNTPVGPRGVVPPRAADDDLRPVLPGYTGPEPDLQPDREPAKSRRVMVGKVGPGPGSCKFKFRSGLSGRLGLDVREHDQRLGRFLALWEG